MQVKEKAGVTSLRRICHKFLYSRLWPSLDLISPKLVLYGQADKANDRTASLLKIVHMHETSGF